MARAIKSLAVVADKLSPENQLQMSGQSAMEARYLWTGLLLLGRLLPDKFDHRSIKNYVSGFDEKKELGYIDLFGSYSLYHTVFTKHLTQEGVIRYIAQSTDEMAEKKREEMRLKALEEARARELELVRLKELEATKRREQEEKRQREQAEADRRDPEGARPREQEAALQKAIADAKIREQEDARRRQQEDVMRKELEEQKRKKLEAERQLAEKIVRLSKQLLVAERN